jgi:hypothetical protein
MRRVNKTRATTIKNGSEYCWQIYYFGVIDDCLTINNDAGDADDGVVVIIMGVWSVQREIGVAAIVAKLLLQRYR